MPGIKRNKRPQIDFSEKLLNKAGNSRPDPAKTKF